jgi:hypothetical protein
MQPAQTASAQGGAPRTVRELVDGILDEAERRARESRMPYVEMLVGLRREMGTAGVVNIIRRTCLPAYRRGPDDFRDFIAMEVQRQYEACLKAGRHDLIGWSPSPADFDFAVDSVRRIVEQLA